MGSHSQEGEGSGARLWKCDCKLLGAEGTDDGFVSEVGIAWGLVFAGGEPVGWGNG